MTLTQASTQVNLVRTYFMHIRAFSMHVGHEAGVATRSFHSMHETGSAKHRNLPSGGLFPAGLLSILGWEKPPCRPKSARPACVAGCCAGPVERRHATEN